MKPFEEKFKKVAQELENLDQEWSIEDVPHSYEKYLIHKNEVCSWSVHRKTAELLKFLVVAIKAKVILELGTSVGYSTLWLAWGAKITSGRVYTIELFEPKVKVAEKYFKKARLDKYIIQIHGEINEELDKWNRPVDFLFIDADKQNYLTYLNKLLPYLKKGGMVIADDVEYFAHLVQNFLTFVKNNQSLESLCLKIDYGLLLAIKK